MTKFAGRGKVRLGRGPAYQLMKAKCLEIDSLAIPNDFSVRTYACQNLEKDQRIVGQATFAFECGDGGPGSSCTKKQINGETKKAWNCKGINKKPHT